MHIHEAHGILGVIGDAMMITGFVFVIMLVVEYFEVLTRGALQGRMGRQGWRQYLLGAVLGAIPGCLGGFAVASMYSHGVFSLGATIATMIAMTGDEAFVMLATFPRQALLMTVFLMLLGIIVGWLTDLFMWKLRSDRSLCNQKFEVHEEACDCFATGNILRQWRECSPSRGILAVALGVFVTAILLGRWESDEWDWVRITLILLSSVAFFIVTTVPDHFLEKHLWEHIARKHVPKIFGWTLGALLVMYFFTGVLESESFKRGIAGHEARWIALFLACLVGLVPESGPNLIFVFAYANGTIPFGVLLANSIVQDGHAMLPVLADSRRVFAGIKLLKFLLGLLIGGAAILLDI